MFRAAPLSAGGRSQGTGPSVPTNSSFLVHVPLEIGFPTRSVRRIAQGSWLMSSNSCGNAAQEPGKTRVVAGFSELVGTDGHRSLRYDERALGAEVWLFEAAADLVDEDGEEEHDAADGVLIEGFDVHEAETVVEAPHQDGAE